MAASRLTLTGRLLPRHDPGMKRIFLARHPDAARYAGFTDFSLYRFDVEAGHLVAGFGRIVDLGAAELTTAKRRRLSDRAAAQLSRKFLSVGGDWRCGRRVARIGRHGRGHGNPRQRGNIP